MSFISDVIDGIFGDGGTTVDNQGTRAEEQTGTIRDNNRSITDTQQSQQTGSVSATSQTSTTNNSQTSRLLTDEQIAAGNVLLQRLASKSEIDLSGVAARVAGSNDSALKAARDLLARADESEAALNGNVKDVISAARQESKRAVDKQYQTVVGNAGSQFSSAAQDIFARATSEQEIALAGLAAEMAQKNRAQATQEFVASVQALTTLGGQIAQSELAIPLAGANIRSLDATSATNLLNAIKGGISTTTGTSTTNTSGRTETQQTTNTNTRSVVDAVNDRNIDINSNIVTSGNSNTNESDGLLDLIRALQ